jgi:hypothetical protein
MRKQFFILSLLLVISAGVAATYTAAQTKRKPVRKPRAVRKQTTSSAAIAKPSAASDATPSVEQIFDKYVVAIGGRDAIRKINSRVARGTFQLTAMGVSAQLETYEMAPNKSLMVINLPGFGEIRQGFNGTVAYEQQPQSGLRELSGKELAKAQRNADFYDDLNLKGQYTKSSVTGVEVIGGAEAYRIEATTPEGDVEKLYFDKISGLLVRKDEAAETPRGVFPVQTYFEDYRVVDGVKLPFTVRSTNPSIGNIVIRFTEVKQNVAIESLKFNKPSAQ